MIQKILMSNFKSSPEGVELRIPRMALLVGRNGSGKTQAEQAIKLAISGKLPEAGVSGTSDVFALANSAPGVEQMEVGLEIDSGFSFVRRYTQKLRHDPETGKSKASISQDIELTPDKNEGALAEKEARIRAECGIDAVMLDVSEFLGMSADKRRDYFYALGGQAKPLDEDEIKGILNRQSAKLPSHSRAAFDELADELLKSWSGSLDKLLNWLDGQKKQAAADVRRLRAATEHLGRAKEQHQAVAGDLKGLKADLERARDEKEKLTGELNKRESQIAAINERQARLDDLTAKIARLKDQDAPDVGALRKELAAAEKGLDKAKNESVTKRNKLKAAVDKATKRVEEWDGQMQEVHDDLISLTNQAEAVEKLGELREKLCEDCRKLVGEPASLADEIELARSNEHQVAKRLAEARDAATKASAELDQHEREAERKAADLRNQIDKIPHDIQRAEQAEEQRKADLEAAQEELKRLQGQKLDEPLPAEQTEARLAGVKERITELEERHEEKQEEEQTIKQQLQAIAEAQEAETRQHCCKMMIKLFGPSGLKGDLVRQVLEPVRYEVNECLRMFGLKGKEFAFRMVDNRGNEVFDFGWTDENGRYVTFDSLSTGQQTMLLASLVAVICKRSDSPLKMLALDNLEVVDDHNGPAFYNGLPLVADYCELDNLLAASSKWDRAESIPYDIPDTLGVIEFAGDESRQADEQEAETATA